MSEKTCDVFECKRLAIATLAGNASFLGTRLMDINVCALHRDADLEWDLTGRIWVRETFRETSTPTQGE